MSRWVGGPIDVMQETEVYDLDGIPWHQAPKPRRWHRCKAQTRGWIRWLTYVERCACGAIGDGRVWANRNSR